MSWAFNLSWLFALRVVLALALPMLDCDETYNYWEPLHEIMYGNGLQTWEYSPRYALRSWMYVLFHYMLAVPGLSLGLSKPGIFYCVRLGLSLITAIGELVFAHGVKYRFGAQTARLALLISSTSTGVGIASSAFLPSAFVMTCHYYAMGFWLRYDSHKKGRFVPVIVAVVVGGILGWPFGAACMLPAALDTLYVYGLLRPLFVAFFSVAVMSICVAGTDTFFYCKPVFSTLQIFIYNVAAGDGRGSHLYGVEPVTYFFKNLLLNFNIMFPLAAVSPLLILVGSRREKYGARHALYVSPFLLWFIFWCFIPHKEERFMFPAYPAIVLGGAVSTTIVSRLTHRNVASLLLIGFMLLSGSRSLGLINFYGAPQRTQQALYDHIESVEPLLLAGKDMSAGPPTLHVCFGKEWFRFPSHFFLKERTEKARYRFGFIPSEFKGQLPVHFRTMTGNRLATCHNGGVFNDRNLEEVSRYVPLDKCDILIDSDFLDQKEVRHYRDRHSWSLLKVMPILDAGRSSSWTRTFYIPQFSERRAVWGQYFILRRMSPLGDGVPPRGRSGASGQHRDEEYLLGGANLLKDHNVPSAVM